ELLGIPARSIAPEARVGRTSDGLLAGRAELMRTGIGAVGRRAGSLIAGPVEPDRIGVTLIHCARSLAATGSGTLPCFCGLAHVPMRSKSLLQLSAVVPAQAGTQYSWAIVAIPRRICAISVYWVPAFAGTTAERTRFY